MKPGPDQATKRVPGVILVENPPPPLTELRQRGG